VLVAQQQKSFEARFLLSLLLVCATTLTLVVALTFSALVLKQSLLFKNFSFNFEEAFYSIQPQICHFLLG